jgi:hypothetical protein
VQKTGALGMTSHNLSAIYLSAIYLSAIFNSRTEQYIRIDLLVFRALRHVCTFPNAIPLGNAQHRAIGFPVMQVTATGYAAIRTTAVYSMSSI